MRPIAMILDARRNPGTLAFIVLLVSSTTAYANAGTPLMWAGMIHLIAGNALIGLGEGLLLAFIFKANRKKCTFLMIAANYLSAWVGGLILPQFAAPYLHLDLYNGRLWLGVFVVAAFVATLVLELPLVALCLRGFPVMPGLKKILAINLLVQFTSYLVLTVWYLSVSPISLYTKFKIVNSSEMTPVKEALVYVIATSDGNVYSMRLDGSEQKKIYALQSSHKNDRLFVKKISDDRWDLGVRLDDETREGKTLILATNLQSTAVEDWKTGQSDRIENTWFNFGSASRLAKTNQWEFSTGFWAAGGIYGKNVQTGERLYCALETPFLNWYMRNATQLPDEQIVFQLGEGQICILDPTTKRIAMIARGRGPVVALDQPAEEN